MIYSSEEENKIIIDNMNLIRDTAMKFKPRNYHHFEELVQIASIGMLKAIRAWDGERNFSTLAVVVMRRQIMNYIRSMSRHFHVFPLSTTPNDSLIYFQEENPTDYLPDNLTKEERTIYLMRLERYTNREIADVLGLTYKEFKDILRSMIRKVKDANETPNTIR